MSGGGRPRAPAWVWLDGRVLRAEQARIPALSETVLLGRGLFESMRVARGRVPLLDLHLERLDAACRALGLPSPGAGVEGGIEALLRRAALRRGRLRLTVGAGFVLVTLGPLPRELAREQREGVRLPVARFDWSPAHYKHTSRAALLAAEERAGGEVVRLGARGRLLETTRSNLFVVGRDGVLETPRVPSVLPGVARRLILEDATRLGIGVRLRSPRLGEQGHWREVFVTNAVRGVRPVFALDGKPLPAPDPGGVLRRLQRELDARWG